MPDDSNVEETVNGSPVPKEIQEHNEAKTDQLKQQAQDIIAKLQTWITRGPIPGSDSYVSLRKDAEKLVEEVTEFEPPRYYFLRRVTNETIVELLAGRGPNLDPLWTTEILSAQLLTASQAMKLLTVFTAEHEAAVKAGERRVMGGGRACTFSSVLVDQVLKELQSERETELVELALIELG